MSLYIIIRCLNCGQPLIARSGQKSKNCTYCGRKLDISKARVFAKAASSREATQIVIQLKKPDAT
ncbi:DUF1922 domain-containing protein [Candidatus Bathyarchaeota archaeon]|nr:DUF1922 domain-containing protein [Candidatus Bathyarchaeota archaeon]